MKKLLSLLFTFVALSACSQPILRNPFTTNDSPTALTLVTNIAQGAASSVSSSNTWHLMGNNIASSNWFGTSNNLPLIIKQNEIEVGRIQRDIASKEASVVMGVGNTNTSPAAFMAGAQSIIQGWSPYSVIAGGNSNLINGGTSNTISFIEQGSDTISGGQSNRIVASSFSGGNVIAGGKQNSIVDSANDCHVIGGGWVNTNSSAFGVIAGGWFNFVTGTGGVVSGGHSNSISGLFSTIAGGRENAISADYAYAAGFKAGVTNQGSFMWGDTTAAGLRNTKSNNTFVVYAAGGVTINTNDPSGANALHVLGNINATSISYNGTNLGTMMTNIAGTVSSQPRYTLYLNHTAFNPADATTYYLGGGIQGTYDQTKIEVPIGGTLKRVFLKIVCAGAASGETVSTYIRINDTTDVAQIDTTMDSSPRNLNTTLSQSVSTGDFVSIKVVTPTWGTNPTTCFWVAVLYFE